MKNGAEFQKLTRELQDIKAQYEDLQSKVKNAVESQITQLFATKFRNIDRLYQDNGVSKSQSIDVRGSQKDMTARSKESEL